MKTVYLVGIISEDPKSHTWRKEATKLLSGKFHVNDPTISKFDRETLKEAKGDPEKMRALVDRYQARVLLPKSFQSIEDSDIVLVNLAIWHTSRPLMGTIMEIAWAYALHKVIFAIRGDNVYCTHPMIQGCVHAWSDTVAEACDMIQLFFN